MVEEAREGDVTDVTVLEREGLRDTTVLETEATDVAVGLRMVGSVWLRRCVIARRRLRSYLLLRDGVLLGADCIVSGLFFGAGGRGIAGDALPVQTGEGGAAGGISVDSSSSSSCLPPLTHASCHSGTSSFAGSIDRMEISLGTFAFVFCSKVLSKGGDRRFESFEIDDTSEATRSMLLLSGRGNEFIELLSSSSSSSSEDGFLSR
jgi:hypothetical protein